MTTPQQDPLAAAGRLSASLEGMKDELRQARETAEEAKASAGAVSRRERRTRHLAWGLLVSLAVDAVITGFLVSNNITLGDVQGRTGRNSATVSQLRTANLQGCQVNNVRLERQKAAIDSILEPAKSSTTTTTPAEQEAIGKYLAQARAKINVAWGARNCETAYSLKGS